MWERVWEMMMGRFERCWGLVWVLLKHGLREWVRGFL